MAFLYNVQLSKSAVEFQALCFDSWTMNKLYLAMMDSGKGKTFENVKAY